MNKGPLSMGIRALELKIETVESKLKCRLPAWDISKGKLGLWGMGSEYLISWAVEDEAGNRSWVS